MSGLDELERPEAPRDAGPSAAGAGATAAAAAPAAVAGAPSGAGDGASAGIPGRADAHAARGAGDAVGTRSRVPADEVAAAGGPEPATPRRGGADPVKTLMHRHRELCERAVDPLEIAAALEAHGVTDRTAARFRHRDVFSLAEEMYARVPRDADAPPPAAHTAAPRPRLDWALLTLLPGVLCAATVTGVRLTHGRTALLVAAAGLLAVVLAVHAALRRGPLSTHRGAHPGPHRTEAWTCWLLAYAALGDSLLRAAVGGGPDGLPDGTAAGPWPVAAAPLLALTLACAPAAWCAHLLATRARRRLNASRGLDEFAASVPPLLLGVFVLFLCALAALTALSAAVLGETAGYGQILTLGGLLFLARLLIVHGFTHAPAVVLGTAGAVEALAPAAVFSGRLPGCDFLTVPVENLLTAWGPGGVPFLVCGSAALALLVHAARTLSRASAHAGTDQPC
ncbi:hypothetical protein [Streptomyces sp. AK04-3B]|uniref:hypothetical protein n=1 Tax=Streptomyces sp. AK04-3B TaxID=3028650 RepID=UPI0029A80CEE|nr:hypothetical protein [Streptomyces sp. AK04-3B]MDX3798500.1 hypothetical protein [Streptomyces sp. AK04-3B]